MCGIEEISWLLPLGRVGRKGSTHRSDSQGPLSLLGVIVNRESQTKSGLSILQGVLKFNFDGSALGNTPGV